MLVIDKDDDPKKIVEHLSIKGTCHSYMFVSTDIKYKMKNVDKERFFPSISEL